MNDERMIAIHPNTMGFGYVILNEKGEILDYGIVSIRPVQNDRCLARIKEIVCYYQPEILILEDSKNSNKSERIKKLIERICDCGKDKFKIYQYSREQIRDTFNLFGTRNKYEISKKISEAYPQLKSKLPDKRKPWEPENYYQGIFDALALVLTHHYLAD
ncbi:MAG TPA: hypothetical protein VFC36_03215 [Paludibacter sp.]|nr:hypothetical protein [Paludibacter sp.]